ncbi:MAG: cytochrome c biogenesis protein CcsA [Candidatus Hodarchaeales archaeon]
MARELIYENRSRILLALASCFTIINFYLVYITVKSFQGFRVSGHPIFYMVPFAFSTYLCFGVVLLSGILYLVKKNFPSEGFSDLLLVSGAQTGVVMGAITITVGMIWSYVEWGYFWQWEPRQTSTLIMWLALVGLLIFREMLDEKNPEKRALISAVFGIATFPSVLLSNYVVGALHPPPQQTTLGEGVGMYLMLNFLFIGGLAVTLIFLAFQVNKIDLKLQKVRRIKMEEA